MTLMNKSYKEADTLKMTYFQKPDHSYHRVIFEFTDTEMKAAGFEKLSLQPSRLEILRVLQRITENDTKRLDVPWAFSITAPLGIPYGTDENEKSKEAYLSEMQETMKRFSREDHADLQRKKDGWKGKALRLIDFLNDKDNEVKRLKAEKEWLIKFIYNHMCETSISMDVYRESLIPMMQQALRDQS